MILSRLKYYIALSVLAACQSGLDEPDGNASGNEMTFCIDVKSRAEVVTNNNIIQSPFVVYGDMTSATLKTTVFTGSPVTFNNLTNKWTYSNTQYWFPQYEYSFVALYPAKVPNLSALQYSNSKLEFTYTYPVTNYKDASEVLIATHRRNYIGGSTDPVSFRFSHILTNFSVDVTYKDPAVDALPLMITGITLKNIPTAATYAIAPASLTGGSPMTSDYVYDEATLDGWTITGRGDLEIKFPADDTDVKRIPDDKVSHHIFSDSDALLLLPNQQASTEMLISYTTYEGYGAVSHARTATVTIPNGWKPGLNYVLSLTFINDKTQFHVEVADWKPTTPIDTTVPRK